jgi:broad specificity phosphatase PhoE
MPTLYLVRHGQASFGAADYDNLSELGHNQAQQLGAYFKAKKLRFDAAYLGTLRRHTQTFEGIAKGLGLEPQALAPQARAGLNEYDSEAVLASMQTPGAQLLQSPHTPEGYRQHFRRLREGLAAWMDGSLQPSGMPSYTDFVSGITQVLDEVRHTHGNRDDARVLLVSSGGPISTALGQVLGASAPTTIELNFRIRNSSVTELAFTPKRHMLVTYNTLPHLDAPEFERWVTYA